MRTVLAGAALVALSQAAGAQSIEEIDRLVAASANPADAVALAQSQAAAGHLLEALATLERLLAAQPKTMQARLLHASLLCRIDDKTGGAVEFGRLKSGSFKKADWDAARAPCGTIAPARQETDRWQRLRDRRRGF